MISSKQLLLLLIAFVSILLFFNTQTKHNFLNKEKFNLLAMDQFKKMPNKDQITYLKDAAKKTSIEHTRDFLKKVYPSEPSDKHELIHAIGEAAFLQSGYNGLKECDSSFMYGCYHGVVLEAVRQNGYTDKVLKDLAQGCVNLSANKTVTTACSHGIGHAIMVVKSYDLLTSYKDCDRTFTAGEELFYCWDGVSMENIMRRFEQEGAKRFLKEDDPYYPCNSIPEKYQPACAREHVFYVFQLLNNKDTQKAIDFCMYFSSEKTRFECTSAIGNFLNQAYYDNPRRITDECNKLSSEYTSFCIIKAATQYSFSRQPDKAKLLCEKLPLESDQQNFLVL